MKWTAGNRDNVEDVRSRTGGGMRLGGLGIGGLLLMLILSWATGVDFLSLMGPDAISTGPSVGTGGGGELRTTPEEEKLVDFVDAVMKDAQDMWQGTLGGRYQQTRAVIFRDAIQSACGSAQSATGPFYCPADSLVYLDLGFFTELQQRFRAPGDFAQAYVLAHELGHHVQHLLGIESQVRRLQQARPDQQNELSVRLELQADCFAGVWGHHAAEPGRAAQGKVELESGDIDEGSERCRRDRRRPHPADVRIEGRAGSLYPRFVRAASHLVSSRLRSRRHTGVRDVLEPRPGL